MKYKFLIILILFAACIAKEVPKDLIGQSKMIRVLMEVHLLEARIDEVSVVPKDSIQLVYEHYENLLFDSLGISKEQYEVSFNYYLSNPKEFEKIYSAVVDSLLQKEKIAKEE
ncbi:MAG: DUF4296 domain-containing protein [Bacteroidota bacterium]